MPLLVIVVVLAVVIGVAALYDRRHKGSRVIPSDRSDRTANEAAHSLASRRTFQGFDGTFGG